MKEYIDRFAILKKSENMFDGQRYCTAINTRHVYAMPIADVVEVVRCKDCKHYTDFDVYRCKRLTFHFCNKFGNITRESDFCSYGERKEV